VVEDQQTHTINFIQPPPKITWLKDNSPLVTDARMTIFPSGKIINSFLYFISVIVYSKAAL